MPTMTFGEIKTAVKDELSVYGQTILKDSIIERKINEGLQEFAEYAYCCTKTASLTLSTTDTASSTVTTTDATPTVIASIDVEEGSVVFVEATVIGNQSGGVNAGSSIIKGLFSRTSGGNVTQTGGTEENANLPSGWDVYYTANTTDQTIDIYVVGATSSTIVWGVSAKVTAIPGLTVTLEGAGLYTLPTDMYMPIRYTWDSKKVDVVSTAQMDSAFGAGWEETVGTDILYVIHDNYGERNIRVYPLIEDANVIEGKPLYFTYRYKPATLTATGSIPDIPSQYHPALADYAIGSLYSVNKGNQMNPMMGDRYMAKFYRAVSKAKKQAIVGYSLIPDMRISPNIASYG